MNVPAQGVGLVHGRWKGGEGGGEWVGGRGGDAGEGVADGGFEGVEVFHACFVFGWVGGWMNG